MVKLCHINRSGPVFLRHSVYTCIHKKIYNAHSVCLRQNLISDQRDGISLYQTLDIAFSRTCCGKKIPPVFVHTDTPWAIKTCHSIFVHNFEKCWPILNFFSLLDSAINLQRGTCYISHHTHTTRRYTTLWKNNCKNSKKILTYL